MLLNNLKETAKSIYEFLQPYCVAIYLGGSHCENIIETPHDIDFICFSRTPKEMCNIRAKLSRYLKAHNLPNTYDFIQVRNLQKEEHAYGSYINKKMIKLVGDNITFEFDIINKDRLEYVQILKITVEELLSNKILNKTM